MNLAVVGLGKLGSCLAAVLADGGHDVFGIDTNGDAVRRVVTKEIPEPGFTDLDLSSLTVSCGSLHSDDDAIAAAEMSFIIVPTPSLPNGSFDDQHVLAALREVCKHAKPGHVAVVVSTVSPGTMRRLASLLQSPNVTLVYSPLFVALGSVVKDLRTPDIRLIGAEDSSSPSLLKVNDVLRSLNRLVATRVFYLSWEEAEIVKISVNYGLVQKIATANMIGAACAKVGANAKNVLAAIGQDSRIGSKFLRAGSVPSGPCLPRDAAALVEFLDRVGVDDDIPRAVQRFNHRQVDDVVKFFGEYPAIAILGLAYKPGTPVTDESLGTVVGKQLISLGYKVICHDPMAKTDLPQVATPQEAIAAADAVLIATAWSEYAGIDTMGKPTCDPWGIK